MQLTDHKRMQLVNMFIEYQKGGRDVFRFGQHVAAVLDIEYFGAQMRDIILAVDLMITRGLAPEDLGVPVVFYTDETFRGPHPDPISIQQLAALFVANLERMTLIPAGPLGELGQTLVLTTPPTDQTPKHFEFFDHYSICKARSVGAAK
jgi:hypothetical protein